MNNEQWTKERKLWMPLKSKSVSNTFRNIKTWNNWNTPNMRSSNKTVGFITSIRVLIQCFCDGTEN